MQKSMEKLNANAVGATSSRPLFEETPKNKGITLIALIITVIVMLILVGITINVALNGGLFSKAEEATTKTKIAQIQEALTIKKAEIVAENNGVEEEYTLTISDLSLPAELKTEYENKLKISPDGKLYYDANAVTNKTEQGQFEELGIGEYVETNIGTSTNSYTFKIADIMQKGRRAVDTTRIIPVEEFWPEDVSDELKNNVFDVGFQGALVASNLTFSDSRFTNPFAIGGDQNFEKNWIIYMMLYNNEIGIVVNLDNETTGLGYLHENNYIGSGFENLEITIGLPE